MPRLSHRLKTIRYWHSQVCLKKRTWKKAEINAVIKCMQAQNFTDKNDLPMVDAFENLVMVASYGSFEHTITREQSQFGIQYLRQRYYKITGEARKSCPFGAAQTSILRNFKRFTFVGYREWTNAYGSFRQYTPVYRVYSKDGSYFDYTQGHWGIPEVLFTHRAVSPDLGSAITKAMDRVGYQPFEVCVVKGGK